MDGRGDPQSPHRLTLPLQHRLATSPPPPSSAPQPEAMLPPSLLVLLGWALGAAEAWRNLADGSLASFSATSSSRRTKRAFPFPRRRPSSRKKPRLIRRLKPSRAMEGLLVRQHNELRAKVPASDMEGMVWDAGLARAAQAYAEKCDFRHSTTRVKVGENIWAHSQGDYTNAARLWYDEVYDPSCACGRTFKACCGHYTQLVWASSSRLGCGAAHCTAITGAPGQTHVLICHYAPTGNYLGRPAFRWQTPQQPACSRCPRHKTRCRQGLCY